MHSLEIKMKIKARRNVLRATQELLNMNREYYERNRENIKWLQKLFCPDDELKRTFFRNANKSKERLASTAEQTLALIREIEALKAEYVFLLGKEASEQSK